MMKDDVATATSVGMPSAMQSGATSSPPPTPTRAETKPTQLAASGSMAAWRSSACAKGECASSRMGSSTLLHAGSSELGAPSREVRPTAARPNDAASALRGRPRSTKNQYCAEHGVARASSGSLSSPPSSSRSITKHARKAASTSTCLHGSPPHVRSALHGRAGCAAASMQSWHARMPSPTAGSCRSISRPLCPTLSATVQRRPTDRVTSSPLGKSVRSASPIALPASCAGRRRSGATKSTSGRSASCGWRRVRFTAFCATMLPRMIPCERTIASSIGSLSANISSGTLSPPPPTPADPESTPMRKSAHVTTANAPPEPMP
mmetsp:Transcript_17129/g.53254  ORF Transcript_17129/g.53254 Transcript_17129/m.53254 type:complete len:321 (+) Transcript_17129:332-1294(+)